MLPTFSLLVIASLTLIHIPKSFCLDQLNVTCGQPLRCGNLTFNYPFWGDDRPSSCGYPGFQLSCEGGIPFLASESLRYRVLAIEGWQQRLTVARDDLWNNLCPRFIYETTFNSSIFRYSSGYPNVTLSYGCNISAPAIPQVQFECRENSTTTTSIFYIETTGFNPAGFVCSRSISVPVDQDRSRDLGSSAALQGVLREGFGLQWEADNSVCRECSRSGGRCGYDWTNTSFVCYCNDQSYDRSCTRNANGSRGRSTRQILAIAISFGTIGLISSVAGIYFLVTRSSSCEGMIWWKPHDEKNQNIEAVIKSYGSFAPKCYSLPEIKRMTDSFANLLGQGGYAHVYKGKLPDGRQVAVKVLRDNKGNGEEFINEVASISRTSHVNVVTLLGFCYKAQTRALVYEFMSNGSLDKFIRKKESEDAECRLEWKVLYQIALGTARGLEYLHQGCNTRIVHFDIKPQNILLDEDFCPKISDFGLAKLCKKKESVLSTMGARGTVGYIAPEVFLRGFGSISPKSDVYSYGMMVLEMVGLKGRIQVDTEKSSETYFPNWIYQRLELEKDLGLEGVMNAEEEEGARKMILVGLWCIQLKPSDRPSMSKVVEMLEGSVQSLQIPPKPHLLDSPAAVRSLEESSETSL